MGQLLGILLFRIRRTRSGAHSCSYEEGEFLNTPGLALLGRPATVGSRWRADRCRIEWFGAARNGNVLPRVAGGPASSAGERAWRRTTAGHPRAESHQGQTSDRQPLRQGLPATSARNERWRIRAALLQRYPHLGIDNQD